MRIITPGTYAAIWMLVATLGMHLSGCQQQPDASPRPRPGPTLEAARTPIEAVVLPTAYLRGNDLAGFARISLPPTLLAEVEMAWQHGRSRWPLDELPLSEKLPELLNTLAADKAQTQLRRSFDRQFANQAPELRSAANALGMFGTQYLSQEGDFTADQRSHYIRLTQALSQWAASAPLADRKHAYAAITRLGAAARNTGLRSAEDFSGQGMSGTLTRLSPFVATFKQVLVSYGLDLDADLAQMQVKLESQHGPRARVRMRYLIAGRPVDAVVDVEQIDGHWYLSDFLRHARATSRPAPVPSTGPAS